MNRKKAMWTLKSKWDLDKVDELLLKLPPGHRDIETLKHVKKNNIEGYVTKDYNYAKGMTFGRIFNSQSYQAVTTDIRNICGSEYYHDIENC